MPSSPCFWCRVFNALGRVGNCPRCGLPLERQAAQADNDYNQYDGVKPNSIELKSSIGAEENSEPDEDMVNRPERVKYRSGKTSSEDTISSKTDNEEPTIKETVDRDNIENVKGPSSKSDSNQNDAEQPQRVPHNINRVKRLERQNLGFQDVMSMLRSSQPDSPSASSMRTPENTTEHEINRDKELPAKAIEPEDNTWSQDEESSEANTTNDTSSPTPGWSPPKPPWNKIPVIAGAAIVITVIATLFLTGVIDIGNKADADENNHDSEDYPRYDELHEPRSESEDDSDSASDQVDIDDISEQTVPETEVNQTHVLTPTPEPAVAPTSAPTPDPTAAPTPDPTAAPTPEPTSTLDPTEETPSPTPEPTSEPKPTPTPTLSPTPPPLTRF